MRIGLISQLLGLICSLVAIPSTTAAQKIEIADPSFALTFARVQVGNQDRLLAITSFRDDQVTGYDLSDIQNGQTTDPIDLFLDQGYDQIANFIAGQSANNLETHRTENLLIPVGLTNSHVAAGTNFSAHAEETNYERGPFLFTKKVAPTSSTSPVSAGNTLLDYEVELALVALSDFDLKSTPEYMGLILANDFTDRDALLRNVNAQNIGSGDGFTQGKSAPGFLPVGNLFVIPRNLHNFVSEIELNLTVNGQTRQTATLQQLIWGIDRLLRESVVSQDSIWSFNGEPISLPVNNDVLPARTMVLTGTPEGTAFAGRTTALETYLSEARTSKIYLQPGDVVEIRANKLGTIQSEIIE